MVLLRSRSLWFMWTEADKHYQIKYLDKTATLSILRLFDPHKNTGCLDEKNIKKLLFNQTFRYQQPPVVYKRKTYFMWTEGISEQHLKGNI